MRFVFSMICLFSCASLQAQPILAAGKPGRLEVRIAGEHSLRVTLKPVSFKEDFPFIHPIKNSPVYENHDGSHY